MTPTSLTWRHRQTLEPAQSTWSSRSLTVGPASRSPRTRSRPSSGRSGRGRPASRPTCGSPPTARSSAPTTRSCGRGRRRRRIADSTAAELAELSVPRIADVYEQLGTAFECSVDVKSPDAARRARRGRPPLRRARAAVGVQPGSRRAAAVARRAGGQAGALGPARTRSRCRSSATRTSSGSIGIDAMNMHHSEWTAGLVSLFHRFDVLAFAWDTQEVRQLRAVLRMQIDAVYCDRPDRMVATVGEWTILDDAGTT